MEEEISIKDLLQALWRKKILVLIVTIVFFMLGIIIYGKNNYNSENSKISSLDNEKNTEVFYIQTEFTLARGIDKVVDGVENTYKLTIDSGVITNLNSFSKSKMFLENILNELNSKENVEDVKENINIIGNGTSDILTLIVASEKEEEALAISNKILENLVDKTSKIYQISEIIIIDGPVKLERKNIEELKEKLKSDNFITEENVIVDDEEVSSPKKKIVLITLVGFVCICGVIVIVEIFSSSVKSEENLEKSTNLKVLVKIPKTNLDLTDKFEVLRVKLNNFKTILITSPENKDGKSFIALNLAKLFARFGKKVLYTDARVLSSDKDLYEDMHESSIKNLTTNLTKTDYSEIVEVTDEKIEERLKKLEQTYDIIIIDSNNVIESANVLAISKFVKCIALVASERKTKIGNIIRAKNTLEDMGCKVEGCILNKTSKR